MRRGRSMKRAAWSDEIDFSKETEHVAGKNGFSRNGMFMKMWLIRDGQLELLRLVTAPSGTMETRFLCSIQSLRTCAHEEVGRSGGDQHGE